ncbi:hypothetical protein HMPREF0724_11784 [Prescottella equi ATCC 33707]|uniref:HNH domain-containing protein n=1 Tax=Prescottella equi ATCC 33707 TaxID=525370 RepID=E9T083_RHOHA|nr:hypothetical protein HMPREF0724_11784 [Prescottella equi ATCC 33707]
MYRDAAKNIDGRPLEADHSHARSRGGTQADRLLHSECNRSRQDGARDHLRPTLDRGIGDAGGQATRPAAFPWPELP